MKPIFATALLTICCVTAIYSQPAQDITGQILNDALTNQTAYNNLKILSELGPRLTGTEGSMRAIKWAESLMMESGFDLVWLQPVTAPYWERGETESLEIISPGPYRGKKLNIAALGRSIGTPEGGLTAGIIRVDSIGVIRDHQFDASGKIIFYDEKFDHSLINTFSAYGKNVKQRSKGAVEAAKLGAVASIVRSVTSRHDDVPHTGVMSYADTVGKIPGVAISTVGADFLAGALKVQPDLQVRLQLSCQNLDSTTSYNVIGEIKGSRYPEEIIVVGGHFDSWDKGHGSHDDGGGCLQALEVLNIFKRLNIQPSRTIRCVLFIDEEQRQTGARTYAAISDSLKEKHFAAIESDRGVFTPRGFSVQADSIMIEHMQKWLPLLEPAGIDWIRAGGSGVDISKIRNSRALVGLVVDNQRYFDYHHSANDTFDKVHPREMAMGTAAMAILTYLLSEQ